MDEMERVPPDEPCELLAFFCNDRLVLFLALCTCVNFRIEHGLRRVARAPEMSKELYSRPVLSVQLIEPNKQPNKDFKRLIDAIVYSTLLYSK